MTIEAIPLIPPTLCLRPDSTQLEALHKLLEQGVNHAPVCDGEAWVGVVTIRDLLGEVLPVSARMEHGLADLRFVGDAAAMLTGHLKDMGQHTVAELIRRDVPTLRRDHRLMDAALLLYQQAMPLPVLDADGRLLGMLSARALLRYLSEKAGV
jgi:CBS-domain-containing membrane protein